MTLIEALERENVKPELPQFNVGDTVKVYNKIVEGTRERIQVFEGVVIARKNSSVRETFTVRRISFGVGVEKIFQLNSPRIDKIEVVKAKYATLKQGVAEENVMFEQIYSTINNASLSC